MPVNPIVIVGTVGTALFLKSLEKEEFDVLLVYLFLLCSQRLGFHCYTVG